VQQVPDRPSEQDAAKTVPTTSVSQVRQIVVRLLAARACTVEQVALQFGVNRRTVHRYLAREGHTFSAILESVRRDLARGYVSDRSHSLAEVSALLGFATPSSFSRWYRRNFGANPAADRKPRTLGFAFFAGSPCSGRRGFEPPALDDLR
jgi:AraC-like DNA-binding protein